MATVPYRETPTTEPVAVPTPYESLHTPTASPASFGAGLAQGEQQAGQDLRVAGQHWGEIAADDAANNFQKQADHLIDGDPNKTVTDPDGTVHPDTGYMGLKGGEALRQRGDYENRLEQLTRQIRSGLIGSNEQLQFDNFTRRYRAVTSSRMGTHATTQANVYAMGVAKGQAEINLNAITQNPNDDEQFKHREADVVDGFVKMAEQGGAQQGDAQWNAAVQEGQRAAANARIRSIGVKDPARAAAMVEENKGVLGKDYSVLGDHYRTRAEEEGGASIGADAYGTVSSEEPTAGPAAPTTGHLNEETQSVLGNIQDGLKAQGIDVSPSSTYRSTAHNAQVGGRQASRHTTGQAFDLPTAGKSQDQLEKMFDAIAGQAGVTQIGWEGDHFHVGTGQHAKGKIAFGPNKNDLAGAPDWFVQKVKTWQGTAVPVTGSPTAGAAPGTHLNSEDEAAYQKWAQERSAARGFNVDSPDYDMRGYWKEHGQGATPQGDEHYPDTYKLPNHPTFSVESKYSTPENPGGQWVKTEGGQQLFIAGPANVANGIEKTRAYLQNNDPDVQLVVPQGLQGNGTPAQQPTQDAPAVRAAQRRAAAIDKIVRSDMNPRMKSSAIRTINELATADQLKWAAEEKAQKEAANAGMDDYVKQMAPGQIVPPNIVQLITKDPRFNHNPVIREHLLDIAKRQSGSDVQQAAQTYGPGFWNLFQRLKPGAADRLVDPTELLSHAGPGGDITLSGMKALRETMAEYRKSPDATQLQTSLTSLIAGAKREMSFEKDLGPLRIRDPKGEAFFHDEFVPQFLSAYSKWVGKEGNDPWQFLTKENRDKFIAGMPGARSKAQMKRDELEATGQVMPQAEAPNTPLPPVPEGVNANGWKTLMNQVPVLRTGQQATHLQWSQALDILRNNPDDKTKAKFNDWFGQAGYNADEVLRSMSGGSAPVPKAPQPGDQPAPVSAPAPGQKAEVEPTERGEPQQHREDREIRHAAIQEGLLAIAEGRQPRFEVPNQKPAYSWADLGHAIKRGIERLPVADIAAGTTGMPSNVGEQLKEAQVRSTEVARADLRAQISRVDKRAGEIPKGDDPYLSARREVVAKQRAWLEEQLEDLK